MDGSAMECEGGGYCQHHSDGLRERVSSCWLRIVVVPVVWGGELSLSLSLSLCGVMALDATRLISHRPASLPCRSKGPMIHGTGRTDCHWQTPHTALLSPPRHSLHPPSILSSTRPRPPRPIPTPPPPPPPPLPRRRRPEAPLSTAWLSLQTQTTLCKPLCTPIAARALRPCSAPGACCSCALASPRPQAASTSLPAAATNLTLHLHPHTTRSLPPYTSTSPDPSFLACRPLVNHAAVVPTPLPSRDHNPTSSSSSSSSKKTVPTLLGQPSLPLHSFLTAVFCFAIPFDWT